MDSETLGIVLKAVGSVAGTVLSLIFQPPKRLSEFVTRASFSLIAGFLFADVTHDYLKWPQTWQMDLAAGALTSALSWFIMGAITRMIRKWTPTKE